MSSAQIVQSIFRTVWLVLRARPPLGDETGEVQRRQWCRTESDNLTQEPKVFILIGLAASAVALLFHFGTNDANYFFEVDTTAFEPIRFLLLLTNVVLALTFFFVLAVLAITFLGIALWREHKVCRQSIVDFALYWLGEMLIVQALTILLMLFWVWLGGVSGAVGSLIGPLAGLTMLFGIIHLIYMVVLQPGLAWARLLNTSRVRLVLTQFLSILPVLFVVAIPDFLVFLGVMDPIEPRVYPDVIRVPRQ